MPFKELSYLDSVSEDQAIGAEHKNIQKAYQAK